MTENLSFFSLVSLMDPNEGICSKNLEKFLTIPRDCFSAIRLVLPEIDRERCFYGRKDSILASVLAALGFSGDIAPDALAKIETEIAKKANKSLGLSIKKINEYLDRVAFEHHRAKQVFLTLIEKTNPVEMMNILSIILRNREPCWYLSSWLNLDDDPRCFTVDSAKLLCMLRTREPGGVCFAARYRIHQFQPPTATSLRLRLHLDKSFKLPHKSDVCNVYTVYDKAKQSVDIWYTDSEHSSDQITWITCTSHRLRSAQSRSFLEDEGAIMSALAKRAIEPYLFIQPRPPMLEVHSHFFPHDVESSSFPHLLSITTSRLITGWESSFDVLQRNPKLKMSKGCLVVCTKISETQHLDWRTTKVGKLVIPRFILQRIGKENLDPISTRLFLNLVAQITRRYAIDDIVTNFAKFLPELCAYQVLHLLIHCTYWIRELGMEEIVENLCFTLASRIVAASNSPNPESYAAQLLHLES